MYFSCRNKQIFQSFSDQLNTLGVSCYLWSARFFDQSSISLHHSRWLPPTQPAAIYCGQHPRGKANNNLTLGLWLVWRMARQSLIEHCLVWPWLNKVYNIYRSLNDVKTPHMFINIIHNMPQDQSSMGFHPSLDRFTINSKIDKKFKFCSKKQSASSSCY